MNINEFKIGTAVVRTKKSEIVGDRSYMGERLVLKGIANGCIYLERSEDDIISKMTGKTELKLRADDFSNGWEYYQEVDLNNSNEQLKFNFKAELQKAIDNEDYELLAELKDIFNETVPK